MEQVTTTTQTNQPLLLGRLMDCKAPRKTRSDATGLTQYQRVKADPIRYKKNLCYNYIYRLRKAKTGTMPDDELETYLIKVTEDYMRK
jgi:hypothetical protein